MNVKKLLRMKNVRAVGLKTFVSVAIIALAQLFVSEILVQTAFFKEHLEIPLVFQIGKGIISLSITNALIFGFVAFTIIAYKKKNKLRDESFKASNLWYALSAIIFLLLHYLLKFLINRDTSFFLQAAPFWAAVKLLLSILFCVSVFYAVFGNRFMIGFFKTFKSEIMIASAVTIGFFVLMLGVQHLWTLFSGIISSILHWVFELFFDNVVYEPFVVRLTMAEGGGPLLGMEGFRAIVGKPCSGIDSFLLFTSLYALIFMVDYRKMDTKKAAIAFGIGAMGMFIVNLIRILLLFVVGAFVSEEFAVGLFHTNVGWILFIAYFFVFWGIVSKHLYLKGAKGGKQ